MGVLSIVATPIGNLEDITLRALRVLRGCDCIYAEDTRVIAKLLAHHGISKKPVHRLDAATEERKADEIVARLEKGQRVAYVSDAGTPGLSDPGARLVARVRAALPEANIEAVPGPSALAAALSVAGESIETFTFMGFLPLKKGRLTALNTIAGSAHPVVLYESPHRIGKLLGELASIGIERATIARELTKIHEEVRAGHPRELAEDLDRRGAARGEFVVIVEPIRR